MFISGGDAESISDIAVLESKQFNISKETTFTFWYTMNGYGSGSLTLTIIADNKPTEVWKIEGRQGKDWLNHSVTLKPGTLKLQFKSTVRIPVGSDLAIDDLHLLSESIEGIVNSIYSRISYKFTCDRYFLILYFYFPFVCSCVLSQSFNWIGFIRFRLK
jgi:hypothetical protein